MTFESSLLKVGVPFLIQSPQISVISLLCTNIWYDVYARILFFSLFFLFSEADY